MDKNEIIERLEKVKQNTKSSNGMSIYYKVGDILMDQIIQALSEPKGVSAEWLAIKWNEYRWETNNKDAWMFKQWLAIKIDYEQSKPKVEVVSAEEVDTYGQKLFDYMSNEHNITLLQTDIQEIERIVLHDYTGQSDAELNAEEMAIFFHNKYEELALSFGYETRIDTKSFDKNTPNGKLMVAVCQQFLNREEGKK